MTGWLKRNWGFLAATLAIAAAVHAASVLFLPRAIMHVALDRMARAQGFNAMTHGERATARARFVVRPSPDLLYSSCPFDLSRVPHGVLRVHADHMPPTYWSVSVFDAETNNVYVVNDRQAKGGAVDFVLSGGARLDAVAHNQIQISSTRGLVLFRTLINDETHLAEIDAGRRHATCGKY